MNKRFTQITVSALIIGFCAFGLTQFTADSKYQPRVEAAEGIDGYFEYIASLRNNQVTGEISQEDVNEVLAQIDAENSYANKIDWPLEWTQAGPDNIGGRTRCLVIDRTDPSILYTGGVGGAVFKSTNKGSSWYPLTSGDDNFGVVSMDQTTDGTIFYGTGEAAFVSVNGSGTGTPGFRGFGVFKSTDGQTFEKVTASTAFGYVSTLTAHPTDNIIFCGSQNGLRYSDDGGDNWTRIRVGSCRDITFNKNGDMLAHIGNTWYRTSTPKDAGSYTAIPNSIISAHTRSASAWSHSDPNVCYIVTVGNNIDINGTAHNGALNGLYRSEDKGENWTKLVNQASLFFAPFANIGVNAQGDYDMALGVNPTDPGHVYIGGVGFAEWTSTDGPRMVGSNFDSPRNPTGIHADKHVIKFDLSGDNAIMYICTDGGIYKTTNNSLDNYAAINTGYATTQFFGMAASVDGRLIGGTQDNNTILISNESYPRLIGQEVISGDGFQTEISKYNPDIMFGESQSGNLRRSIVGGTDMATMWDNRIRQGGFASATTVNGYFNTPLTLWEDPSIILQRQLNGQSNALEAQQDARLFFCTNNGVWMCKNATGPAHNPDNPDSTAVRWFRVATNSNVGTIHASNDGNSLFIGSRSGQLTRIDGINKANFDTTELSGFDQISDSLTAVNISSGLNVGGRVITSIATDANDDNRVIITAGSYGNANYVIETTDALSASPTWSSKQGNLPSFPVYHAIISLDDPDVIVVGTEFGIWATDNGTAASPTWSEMLTGTDASKPFPRSPVFELVQVEEKPWQGPVIYAATHGMGLWKSGSLLTSTEKKPKLTTAPILAYPNPANNSVTLNTQFNGEFELSIYNLNGSIVESISGSTTGDIQIATAELSNGYYFAEVISKGNKATAKIVVQH